MDGSGVLFSDSYYKASGGIIMLVRISLSALMRGSFAERVLLTVTASESGWICVMRDTRLACF